MSLHFLKASSCTGVHSQAESFRNRALSGPVTIAKSSTMPPRLASPKNDQTSFTHSGLGKLDMAFVFAGSKRTPSTDTT